ncbi:hypothetical protein PISMIDRAFT_93767, partial [Pisolithus microcarpus 441]
GSVRLTALSIEDTALFADLFSHLTSADQIPAFLLAFQDLREGRYARLKLRTMQTRISERYQMASNKRNGIVPCASVTHEA